MRKSKFTDEQIMNILENGKSGKKVKEICKRYSISEATYYGWKTKFGGMDAHVITKLKQLEKENRKLQKNNSILLMENLALKDVLEKKNLTYSQKRKLINYLISTHNMSVRNSCKILKLSRNAYNSAASKPKKNDIEEIVLSMIKQNPDYGFRKLYLALRESGYQLNHKRLYRIYCQLELNTRNLRNSQRITKKTNGVKIREEENDTL